MAIEKINTIIIGSLNTDLIISGARKLLGPGESTLAESFKIAPGGKSRNLAAMIATLQGGGQSIAFVSKTLKDKLGFWKYPYESLIDLGIDMSFVQVVESHPKYQFPGLAIIPIDKKGQNQIYLVPEIREDFHREDIQKSEELFKSVGTNNGILGITLEMPIDAAMESMNLAKQYSVKSFVDPGGIEGRPELIEAINIGGFLIKPNEHEAKAITGREVIDFDSAQKAADKLLEIGYEYALITHGDKGAYLFGKDFAEHILIPEMSFANGDSVGCGDQTMAGLIYGLSRQKSIEESARIGVIAGSLQYSKNGVVPVTADELSSYL